MALLPEEQDIPILKLGELQQEIVCLREALDKARERIACLEQTIGTTHESVFGGAELKPRSESPSGARPRVLPR